MTLFDDMVADAEDELLDLDAARAEIWVSAVFGTWRQPGTADDLAPEDVDHLLLEHLAAHPSRGALALALATEAIAPPAFAAAAAAVADTLRAAGFEPPDWAPVAGSAHAVGAWSLQDPHGGSESLVIGFEHADGVRHALMVEIDHADGGMAVDLLFSPGELLDAIVEGPDPTLRTTSLRPEEAARRAVTALDATREHPDPVVTDEFLMNWYLADTRLRRLAGLEASVPGVPIGASPSDGADDADGDEADPDERAAEDRIAAEVLRSALRRELAAPAPADALGDAARRLRAALEHDPDAAVLLEAAGVANPAGLDDRTLLVTAAGALVRPRSLRAFTPIARRLVRSLEWADWLGVVVELTREGTGADTDPARFVRLVNRCPEVSGGIPKRDAPGVIAAFEQVVFAWELTGVTVDGTLTPLGAWLLPQSALGAWTRGA